MLGFICGDHSCSEAGTHFPVLGYVQHDSLDNTVDKNITLAASMQVTQSSITAAAATSTVQPGQPAHPSTSLGLQAQ